MADKTTKTEELTEKTTAAAPKAAHEAAPKAAPATVAAALPIVVGARHVPAPLRLSKGQRKHIRRLKQAGEFKPTDRRR